MAQFYRVTFSNKGEILEQVIREIFAGAGYAVFDVQARDAGYDFVAEKKERYVIEVKSRAGSFLNRAAIILQENTEKYNEGKHIKAKGMLVVADLVDSTLRLAIENTYPNVELIDISQLLYSVHNDEVLRKKLIGCLDFSTDKIKLKKWELVKPRKAASGSALLVNHLKKLKCGKDGYSEYEKICIDILTYLFDDALYKIEPQKTSNKDLFRFDAVARIKSGEKNDFWNIVEINYNSRFILFEFKNYGKKIEQTQIYTTEKYLYDKALRRVGIVISRKGASDNALWAAKGCLRENGKLILNLSDSDLIEMIGIKERGEDPSDYLMEVLKDMLLQLEK